MCFQFPLSHCNLSKKEGNTFPFPYMVDLWLHNKLTKLSYNSGISSTQSKKHSPNLWGWGEIKLQKKYLQQTVMFNSLTGCSHHLCPFAHFNMEIWPLQSLAWDSSWIPIVHKMKLKSLVLVYKALTIWLLLAYLVLSTIILSAPSLPTNTYKNTEHSWNSELYVVLKHTRLSSVLVSAHLPFPLLVF